MNTIRTLGQWKAKGLARPPESVRDEIRRNLIAALRSGKPLFSGIVGYEETVVPQIVNALLARHDFILLGLRGQAKTRLLRQLTDLLDPEIPAIDGCPLNSHPLAPLSAEAKRLVVELGDDLPLRWIPRSERYREKLATPDITVADLIGDIDPIKAAARKLDLADERVIHYGIVPRTNRGIFAINELPDLPTRIQVGLLDLLEERDVQIRGFPVRIPLDVLLVFSANPEDYTNRGSIITPLRDRIESQISTHYPLTLDDGLAITAQEAWIERGEGPRIVVPRYLREVIEETAIQARTSSFVDQNSGVSARMTIALLELVVSNAERRALRAQSARVTPRTADLYAADSAITGKVELVYEGEREGPRAVAAKLIGKAIKVVFDRVLPDPYQDGGGAKVYEKLLGHFRGGGRVTVSDRMSDAQSKEALSVVPDLEALARNFFASHDDAEIAAAMEFILEGLHQASILSKDVALDGATYGDEFDRMVKGLKD
ncbi:MAG: magnesium chelatase [Planctomycetes bacterium]|nr:magnesium chelatase [Planctomycetota bacterium]